MVIICCVIECLVTKSPYDMCPPDFQRGIKMLFLAIYAIIDGCTGSLYIG